MLNKDSEELSLAQEAWEVRQRLKPEIWFSAPGAKHYENRYYANHKHYFVNLSVTGEACACRCDHCSGKLLQNMVPAPTPLKMRQVIDQLQDIGCRGILVSGGANSQGEVPLLPFLDSLAYASQKGLKVLVHSGIITRETAMALKAAHVDQVLMDVIGDQETIHQVYHLDRRPEDYLRAMFFCREADLNIAPHVVIGLHYGQIRGEIQALEMIQQAQPKTIVLVILTPSNGTVMAGLEPPALDQASEVIAQARIMNPDIPITLGCARPSGQYKRIIEIQAVDCGVNGIAYPHEATIDYAQNRGLQTVFTEECCSLIGQNYMRNQMQLPG
ncbi:radical SAM protein [Desulfosporosinus sp. SYSU MS00001]|uniref:radical SAM protein n=1 Tax=Desulfosporosinus sp. SYSU MS00001 TaxID=3416284 RepID=UPI003CEA7A0A